MDIFAKALNRRTLVAGASASAALATLAAAGLAGAQSVTPGASPVASPMAAAATGPTATLRISLIPAESAESMLASAKPLTDYLKKELEVADFQLFVSTDYSGTIEAMKANHVDLALYGPFSYVLGNQVAGAKALVMPGLADGTPSSYNSLIVANKKSGITKLDDLKTGNHSFSFVDPASTSGYLVPSGIMIDAGIDPKKDLKTVFSGGHDASLLAIANGTVDAGAVADATYKKMVAAGAVDEANLVLVVTSPPIPEGPWAYRDGLDPALVERIRESFINFTNVVTDPAVISTVIENGVKFVDAPDSLYDGLRTLAKALNLTPDSLK